MPLTPSERILLIKEIGTRLGGEEWPLIDLTLKQFSLPWSDEWRGDKDAYVLAMIEGGEDSTLLDLARHVGFQLPSASPRVDPPFWRPGMLGLFLTHLATHRQLAAEFKRRCGPIASRRSSHTTTSSRHKNGKRKSRPPWLRATPWSRCCAPASMAAIGPIRRLGLRWAVECQSSPFGSARSLWLHREVPGVRRHRQDCLSHRS